MTVRPCACETCANCAGAAPAARPLDPDRWRHGSLRERLLGRIGRVALGDERPLGRLGSRALDDPAIALLDAFAGGLHVVAWNAARLADDATLTRGSDREMLVDVVALTGYAPKPALSAATVLAFTLDAFTGSPETVVIPKGNRVASQPVAGELPVSFETDEPLEARAAWNRLEPLLKRVRPDVSGASRSVTLAGANSAARPGDLAAVLDEESRGWLVGHIVAVERLPNAALPRTEISFAKLEPVDGLVRLDADFDRLILLAARTAAFGANAPDPLLFLKPSDPAKAADPVSDAIDREKLEWKHLQMGAGNVDPFMVDLDGAISDAAPDRLVFFANSETKAVGRIQSVVAGSRKGFGLSGRITSITLDGKLPGFSDKVRETVIFVETGRETLLRTEDGPPLPDGAPPELLRVKGWHPMPAGRRLVVVRESGGRPAAELITLDKAVQGGDDQTPWTDLRFTAPLKKEFRSSGVALLGNVVPASQGESAATGPETVGAGDATILHPRFRLMRGPVSQISGSTPTGYAPALEVRVDGERYEHSDTLHGIGEDSHAFALLQGGAPGAGIQIAGRIRTGAPVTALYRAGSGAAGNFDPGRLTTALAPMPGVRVVSNPLPADGGADPEGLDAIRTAAPRAVRTMDRAVSLRDFETFAMAYRGVGKAMADELLLGRRRIVALTVATTSLRPPGADLTSALAAAIRESSPPGRTIRVLGFRPLTPTIEVALAHDPRFVRGAVEVGVRDALGNAFGRAARPFGEGLPASAVLATIQGAPGVVGAMLTVFSLDGRAPDHGRLLCPGPTGSLDPATGAIVLSEAGLLAIDPASVRFAELAP